MIEPYYQADRVTLYLGDCIEVMRSLPEASVDAIVTDPPYGIGFMGKQWDQFSEGAVESSWSTRGRNTDVELSRGVNGASFRNPNPRCGRCGRAINGRDTDKGFKVCHCEDPVRVPLPNRDAQRYQQWCETWAREAYRVLKPGGHIAAFGGTRTHHRLVCGIEDAGFEIRDEADWMYGSGFPKSLDVSKAIDRAAGAEREVIGTRPSPRRDGTVDLAQWRYRDGNIETTAPATAEAAKWQGWGTALKPAHEPICIARKPLSGNVAANVLTHGTGALNIDGCRIESPDADLSKRQVNFDAMGYHGASDTEGVATYKPGGRWPANVLLDEEAAALLDATVGDVRAGSAVTGSEPSAVTDGIYGDGFVRPAQASYADRGGPSRFFYTAKASRSEREAGLDDLPPAIRTDGRDPGGSGGDNPRLRVSERRNDHPTVKPVSLMRWLVRLITPPGGVVLDPFLGSGTTGMAALDEGFRFIGIDMTERYVEIARYRVTHRHVIDHEIKPANEAIPQGRLL